MLLTVRGVRGLLCPLFDSGAGSLLTDGRSLGNADGRTDGRGRATALAGAFFAVTVVIAIAILESAIGNALRQRGRNSEHSSICHAGHRRRRVR